MSKLDFVIVAVVSMMLTDTIRPVMAAAESATAVARDFFEKHNNLEGPNFNEYSLEEQYEIFIFGNTCIHPPNMELAIKFSRRGAEVIDLLKRKLNQTDDVLTIVSIIRVFSFMTAVKSYKVANDLELMIFLHAAANDMEEGFWKRKIQHDLKVIAAGQ